MPYNRKKQHGYNSLLSPVKYENRYFEMAESV